LDLGSDFPFAINKQILSQLKDIIPNGTSSHRNYQGKIYESPKYKIPEISVGNLLVTNVDVREVNEEYNKDSVFIFHLPQNIYNQVVKNKEPYDINIPENQGVVGRPVFENYKLLLDFPNATICISNREDFSVSNCIKIPFENSSKGITLTIATDLGPKRFILDTGFTYTVIDETLAPNKQYFQTSSFSIGGKNFGTRYLIVRKIATDYFKVDGFLGMDFLRDHTVYIDFFRQMLYFK